MAKVIVNWDTATGHTDINGDPVVGTVVATNWKIKVDWKLVAVSWDVVTFPSHAHALDGFWDPTDFRTHSIELTWTAKLYNAVLEGATVDVNDEAWPDATLVATQSKLYSV